MCFYVFTSHDTLIPTAIRILANENNTGVWQAAVIFFDSRVAFKKFCWHSVCIPNILAHSCDWQGCFSHAQNFWGALEMQKYRTALEVYSNCTLTAF